MLHEMFGRQQKATQKSNIYVTVQFRKVLHLNMLLQKYTKYI